MKPASLEAYRLLHEGSLALAQIEGNGMKIDMPYLEKALETTQTKIWEKEEELKESKTFKLWTKHYGNKTKLGSHEQLGHLIFTVLEYPCTSYTPTGRPSTDEEAFEAVVLPFVKDWLYVQKL